MLNWPKKCLMTGHYHEDWSTGKVFQVGEKPTRTEAEEGRKSWGGRGTPTRK